MLDSHRREDHRKLRLRSPNLGLPGNLGGQIVVRQAVAGKYRQLLAANQGVHAVDDRYPRLDKIAWILARRRIYRQAVYVQLDITLRRRAAVYRLAETIKNPPQHRARHAEFERSADKTHPGLRKRHPAGSLENLNHHRTGRGFQNDTQTDMPLAIHAFD